MKRRGRFLTLVFLILWILPACSGWNSAEPVVVLISLDGFRPDYLGQGSTPHLDQLGAEGVIARWMTPVFPTKTFPNHYSMVTGLYPENHGIIANNMYDPTLGTFKLSNREAVGDGRWWAGEPVWVTVEKSGRKSATLFWPGSEAEIQGRRPTYWKPFNKELPHQERIEQIFQWLALPPERRPIFIALYFAAVDGAGHTHGPFSPQLYEQVRHLDSLLGRFVADLEERGWRDRVNLILVSDHGMAESSPERIVFLDDYVDLSRVQVVDWSPVAMLRPQKEYQKEVIERLQVHPHLQVYEKSQVPERLHFRNHSRIPPVIAIADSGWSIDSHSRLERRRGHFPKGVHGYDNLDPAMRALFLANGPAFRQGLLANPFESIHVHALILEILNLKSPPSDSSLEPVRDLLRRDQVAAVGPGSSR